MSQTSPTPTFEPEDVKWIALALGVLALVLWAMPAAVVWVHDGHTPRLLPAVEGTVKLIGHHLWAHPRSAYPLGLRRHMPTGPIWWAAAAWALGTLGALAWAVWRRIEDAQTRPNLGRSPGRMRGSKPRSWARRRDVKSLAVSRPPQDRFTLGRLNGQLLASEQEAHVAVIAPTRSGKTTRFVIPWLLEHDGPAIVTSTKTDVLHATQEWRTRQGTVWVWDPFGERSVGWTPLAGCEDWQYALSQAQWLADAAQQGDSEIASYWRGEAARLLAPLLYVAARLPDGHVGHVLEWVDTQDIATPSEILQRLRFEPPLHQLRGIDALDPRNRGSIYMSAGSLLAAYRLPAVQRTAHRELDPEVFFDGKPNTLYLVASSRQQRLLAPLAVALISSLLHAAAEHANRATPLSPTLRVLLDETANIAPLRDLPAHLSQAAGHGIRIATIWQSLAQAHQRYGPSADEILANSTAKLYLGPVTDHTTRQHITGLLGDEPIQTITTTANGQSSTRSTSPIWRPKASAAALQQLSGDRALLIEGRNPPSVIRTAAWWETRQLRRRGQSPPQ
jgi:type IV secretion system protein VirD4